MKSLKSIVKSKLIWLTAFMMVIILLVALFFQIIATQMQAKNNAQAMFVQIQQIIVKSTAELEAIEAEYRETCLLNTQVISYVIMHNPDILGNIEEFRQLARKLEVDEIHIFDETGRIFTGSHPEYYNYTFDSGEQINFFKPLLTDKSLRLCQDITPNTAESKPVQYSAMWSADQKYIIQVGMYPDTVMEVTEKSELSYIFSLLQGTPGVSLYAVDPTTGRIIGSSNGTADIGKKASESGIRLIETKRYERGAHVTINGVDSYCIFKNMDGTLVGYVISNDQLYRNIGSYTLLLALCLLIIAAVMVRVVQKYTERYIIGSISSTNERLKAVTVGNLDERVNIQNSLEFSELSDHINSMIRSLLENTDKMNTVLNRTNLRIGVYEYNTNMKNVRFTEHIPEIFGFTPDEMSQLSGDCTQMQNFINELRLEPVADTENTYRYAGKTEMYLKLEEIATDNYILGIVMDVTEETVSRKRAEAERDIDIMTGLYNRRGLERRLDVLFEKPADMEHGAIIMIDSDNLKDINDAYGHAAGDLLLRDMAELLKSFDAPESLVARIGGDEFVLAIYGYKNGGELQDALSMLNRIQEAAIFTLSDGVTIPLRFSYGYELTRGRTDYERMLSAADANMYDSKRLRKKALAEQSM